MTTTEFESLELFRSLSADGRKLLRQGIIVCKHYAPLDPILHKGQAISGAYFVIRGRLRVYSLSPDGTEATLYFIDPGQTCVFALNSLFNDLRYPAWVQAQSDTSVALIPGAIFRQLFEREPSIQDVTVRALSTLVFRLMEELEEIHSCTLDQRLANLLLAHASAQGEVHMTQQQIAQHLGTTREVVGRLMRDFAGCGYVETSRGLIRIRAGGRLAALISVPG
jgi:CRP/FNR family transcriptional regulator, anaerobic regulatory protein